MASTWSSNSPGNPITSATKASRQIVIGEADRLGTLGNNHFDLELRLFPYPCIECRPIGGLFDQRDARAIIPHEAPECRAKILNVALFAELIDQVVMFAVTDPGLNYAATGIRSAAVAGINTQNDRADGPSVWRKTLEMLGPHL